MVGTCSPNFLGGFGENITLAQESQINLGNIRKQRLGVRKEADTERKGGQLGYMVI